MSKSNVKAKYTSVAYWTQLIQLILHDTLRNYLLSENITQKEFAERLGVSKGYVTQILNGDFDHKLSKLIQLGLACGMVPKFEFVPLSKAEEILKPVYLQPKVWSEAKRFSATQFIKTCSDKRNTGRTETHIVKEISAQPVTAWDATMDLIMEKSA